MSHCLWQTAAHAFTSVMSKLSGDRYVVAFVINNKTIWLDSPDNLGQMAQVTEKDAVLFDFALDEAPTDFLDKVPVARIAKANFLKRSVVMVVPDAVAIDEHYNILIKTKHIGGQTDRTAYESIVSHNLPTVAGHSGCSLFDLAGNTHSIHLGLDRMQRGVAVMATIFTRLLTVPEMPAITPQTFNENEREEERRPRTKAEEQAWLAENQVTLVKMSGHVMTVHPDGSFDYVKGVNAQQFIDEFAEQNGLTYDQAVDYLREAAANQRDMVANKQGMGSAQPERKHGGKQKGGVNMRGHNMTQPQSGKPPAWLLSKQNQPLPPPPTLTRVQPAVPATTKVVSPKQFVADALNPFNSISEARARVEAELDEQWFEQNSQLPPATLKQPHRPGDADPYWEEDKLRDEEIYEQEIIRQRARKPTVSFPKPDDNFAFNILQHPVKSETKPNNSGYKLGLMRPATVVGPIKPIPLEERVLSQTNYSTKESNRAKGEADRIRAETARKERAKLEQERWETMIAACKAEVKELRATGVTVPKPLRQDDPNKTYIQNEYAYWKLVARAHKMAKSNAPVNDPIALQDQIYKIYENLRAMEVGYENMKLRHKSVSEQYEKLTGQQAKNSYGEISEEVSPPFPTSGQSDQLSSFEESEDLINLND